MSEYLFEKVRAIQVFNFIKKRLQRRCFPVKLAEFFYEYLFYRGSAVAASEVFYEGLSL